MRVFGVLIVVLVAVGRNLVNLKKDFNILFFCRLIIFSGFIVGFRKGIRP